MNNNATNSNPTNDNDRQNTGDDDRYNTVDRENRNADDRYNTDDDDRYNTDGYDHYNTVDRENRNAYFKEFFPAIAGYMVTLVLVITFVDFDSTGWWKYLAALLPVVPVVFVIRAVARSLQRSDEFERSVQLKAMSLGFGVAMFGLVTVGLLSITGLETAPGGYWVIFAVSIGVWGGSAISSMNGS